MLGVLVAYDTPRTNVLAINFDPIMQKCENIFNAWSNRRLSLYGKITIINSLIASLFVHKMYVLPLLPDSYINNFEQMCNKFLWNGNRPKIKITQLQQEKNNCGANLVDLRLKDIALKCVWVQILSENQSYECLAFEIFSPVLHKDIFRCNFSKEHVQFILPRSRSVFWHDVLSAWAIYNFSPEKGLDEQIIWWNSCIKIENKPFFWSEAYKRGLRVVTDLYRDRQLMSAGEVMKKYGVNWFDFNAIVSAIPSRWRRMYVGGVSCTESIVYRYDALLKEKKLSCRIYKELLKEKWVVPSSVKRWRDDEEIFQADSFSLHCKHIQTMTISARLRSFQFRFLHRAIVLNTQLYHWGISPSKNCSFCDAEPEALKHLFYTCEIVSKLWCSTEQFIQEITGHVINISWENVVWCKATTDKFSIVDCIILIVKQLIYRQRCLHKSISFSDIRKAIYETRAIEKYIALKNNKMAIHQKKWFLISE